jgi:5-methylcytosine-specific restriction endonuclease McrA
MTYAIYRDRTSKSRLNRNVRRQAYKANTSVEEREIAGDYKIAARDDPCYFCGEPGESWDHLFPLSKGGKHAWYNLVRACNACNHAKADFCVTYFLLHWNEPAETLDSRLTYAVGSVLDQKEKESK